LETIHGDLESSHNFNIISELNVISAIQCREYCLSINNLNLMSHFDTQQTAKIKDAEEVARRVLELVREMKIEMPMPPINMH
jgi:hypothetical protein